LIIALKKGKVIFERPLLMNTQTKVILSGVLVLVLFFAGLTWLNHYNYQSSLIREKDPGLTQDQRKIYEDRIALADAELAKSDLTQDQRFNALMSKGFQLYGLGKLEQSIEWYVKAAEVRPEDPNAYVAMYTSQLDMQDNRAAQKSIKQALELQPLNADAWKKYIVLERERFRAGNETLDGLYQEALSKTGHNIDIHTSYAVFLEGIGNLQGAKEQWQKSVEVYPANKAAYENEIRRLDQVIQTQQ
jgi:tetratricopeptide (TPR) repeat protein